MYICFLLTWLWMLMCTSYLIVCMVITWNNPSDLGTAKTLQPRQSVKSNTSRSASQDETSELSFCKCLFNYVADLIPNGELSITFFEWNSSVDMATFQNVRMLQSWLLSHSRKVIDSSSLAIRSITWLNKHLQKDSSEVSSWDVLEVLDLMGCHGEITPPVYLFLLCRPPIGIVQKAL